MALDILILQLLEKVLNRCKFETMVKDTERFKRLDHVCALYASSEMLLFIFIIDQR